MIPKKINLKCKIYDVPEDCCFIRFKKEKIDHSITDYFSCRGESMTFDVAKGGGIIGIELLGSKQARKPCQETIMKKSDIKKLSEKLKQ